MDGAKHRRFNFSVQTTQFDFCAGTYHLDPSQHHRAKALAASPRRRSAGARGRRGSQSGRQHAGGGGARTTGMEERAIHTGGTPSPRHSPVARGRWRVTTPLLLLRRREPPTSTSGAPLLLTTMPTTCLARATCLAWSAVGLGLRFRRM